MISATLLMGAGDARAQEVVPHVALDASLVSAAAAVSLAPPAVQPDRRSALRPQQTGGSRALWALYGATAFMQAADVHSTRTALSAGAIEGNPVMRGVAGNTPAFIAVKAGMTTATIYAAHRMSRHHKVAAIVTLVAINSAYAMVVKHNYDVARRAGRP